MARRLSKMLKVPKRFQKINWFAWVEKEKMPECKDCHTCSEEVKWDWSLTPTSPSLKYLSYFYPHVIRFASFQRCSWPFTIPCKKLTQSNISLPLDIIDCWLLLMIHDRVFFKQIVNCGVCGKLTEDGDFYREHLVKEHNATEEVVEELFNRHSNQN